jgi:hypothetical protein
MDEQRRAVEPGLNAALEHIRREVFPFHGLGTGHAERGRPTVPR